MTDTGLSTRPAGQLADLMASGCISPIEVVEACLARIEAVQPSLNPFCFVYPDEARAAAHAAADAVAEGKPLGPLHGLPVAIKDLTPTAGRTTTLGSRYFQDWVPDHDAPIVERLVQAGAIVIGKTTTPELASSSFCASALWGVTRNPWNAARTSGGSSGGSGVAVATGCAALAEGSDMGGSVRIPASFCGIVGLKPSFGRIPVYLPPLMFDWTSHHGPLARTIDDAALFLNVTQGPDDRDYHSLPALPPIPRPVPWDVRGMRLALSLDLGHCVVHPDVERAVRAAADVLRQQGAIVEDVALPWSRVYTDAQARYWCAAYATYFGHLPDWRERLPQQLTAWFAQGTTMAAVDLKAVDLVRQELWASLAALHVHYDALLCPTMAQTAPSAALTDLDFGQDGPDGRMHALDMTSPFNLVGACPALSVPAGFDAEGLPVGLQIVGRRFDDEGVLRIGAALEHASPWPLPQIPFPQSRETQEASHVP